MRVCRSRQDLTFQYPCSPLRKGGEGTGVGGFDLLAVFVKSGAAIGIISLQVLPLREGNRAVRPFGSPCEQGEP